MDDSRKIIADNITRLQVIKVLSLKELSQLTGICLSTLKSWHQRKTYPRLKLLDSFCDKLGVHTSDLFEANTSFITPYFEYNSSHKIFMKNFLTLCNQRKLLNEAEILDFLNNGNVLPARFVDVDIISIDALKSYKRRKNGRQIPVQKLDYIAKCFGVETFKLLR